MLKIKNQRKNNSYYIQVFGCQQNVHDADHIAAYLDNLGCKRAQGNNACPPDRRASLVVVMGCSVRQHAVDRIHGMVNKWQKINPDVKIVLCGCVLPQDKKLFSGKVTAICKTEEIEEVINGVLNRPHSNGKMTIHQYSPYYIPIMSGCNRFCTYCATAITKGRERSRPMPEILVELDEAHSAGAKEVMFLGQTVASYGRDKNNFPNFAELLRQTLRRPHNFIISFLSPYPTDFTNELIEVLASSPRIKREFHLPLQSGSNLVLQSMKRQYNLAKYGEIIENIKYAMPNAVITTDIIVGFPGETDAQFQETVAACQKFNFTKAFIGKYSPRLGTYSALHFKDDISKEEKTRRFRIINQLVNKPFTFK